MIRNPLFSIIIPTYGRPAFLQDALDSVLAQEFADYEVIVVDDASPSPVRVAPSSRVRVVRAEANGGPAVARNLGVQASKGRYLTFLDDDDTWTSNRLNLALEGLKRAPIAICWQSPTGGRILNGWVRDSILDGTTPHLGATALQREAWLPFDESYRSCEDLAWWLNITARHPVATVESQGLVVRIHRSPRVGYGAERRIEDSLRLLSEHREYFRSHPGAAAFRWKRIGLMHYSLGHKRKALRAFSSAVRCQPSVAVGGRFVSKLARRSNTTPRSV
jgi:glycosyltransferase involved in cell wall biosynthesis